MKYTLKIVADTNDADYITAMHVITQAELDKITPVIEAINAFKSYSGKSESGMKRTHDHNFPLGDYSPRTDLGEKTVQEIYKNVDTDALDIFLEYVPYGEHGIHTIESIQVTPEIQWKTLQKRKR